MRRLIMSALYAEYSPPPTVGSRSVTPLDPEKRVLTLLQKLETIDLGEGAISKAFPERFLAGDPVFATWNQIDSHEGAVSAGVC